MLLLSVCTDHKTHSASAAAVFPTLSLPLALPDSGTHPSKTCLSSQPLGIAVEGDCLGQQPPSLLLLFTIQGLARHRPYSQLKQTLVWGRVTQGRKRPSESGPSAACISCLLSRPSIHLLVPSLDGWQRWQRKMPL